MKRVALKNCITGEKYRKAHKQIYQFMPAVSLSINL